MGRQLKVWNPIKTVRHSLAIGQPTGDTLQMILIFVFRKWICVEKKREVLVVPSSLSCIHIDKVWLLFQLGKRKLWLTRWGTACFRFQTSRNAADFWSCLRGRRDAQWLEHLLLLQRTRVWFPALGIWTSGLHGHLHLQTHIHMPIYTLKHS